MESWMECWAAEVCAFHLFACVTTLRFGTTSILWSWKMEKQTGMRWGKGTGFVKDLQMEVQLVWKFNAQLSSRRSYPFPPIGRLPMDGWLGWRNISKPMPMLMACVCVVSHCVGTKEPPWMFSNSPEVAGEQPVHYLICAPVWTSDRCWIYFSKHILKWGWTVNPGLVNSLTQQDIHKSHYPEFFLRCYKGVQWNNNKSQSNNTMVVWEA